MSPRKRGEREGGRDRERETESEREPIFSLCKYKSILEYGE